jgi:aminoglycoside/choline kinase family phosphotransferase
MAGPPPTGAELLIALSDRGYPAQLITALPGDVSARSYFRVEMNTGGSGILAWYPEGLRATCERFERTTRLLEEISVKVPRIEFSDSQAGLMLLEDLGPQTLYSFSHRSWPELLPYLQQAAGISRQVASLPQTPVSRLSPPLGHELLSSELDKTWSLVFAPSGPLPGSLPSQLERAFATLIEILADEPPVPCHRDFMGRNLIPVGESPELAVIDHQDLRLGPPTYDLASLLNDSLFAPLEIERQVLDTTLPEEQRPNYHRAAAQRTLKAIGTFLAFAARGNRRHLSLIPPSLAAARRHLSDLPECQAAAGDIRELWEQLDRALPADSSGQVDLLD